MNDPLVLMVYVPRDEAMLGIKPGSAVVGALTHDPRGVLVYYEGGLYHQSGFEEFRTRLLHAAGRLVERYPTTAKALVPREALHAVGTYTPHNAFLNVTDGQLLDAWIARWRPGQ